MKRLIVAAFAIGALVTPAMATDLALPVYRAPPPPIPVSAFSWTGCYIGADIGGAWSSQDVSNTAPPINGQAGVTGTINASGAIGGGYLGCNYQWSPAWVVGIEGDLSGTQLSGTALAPNLFAGGAPVGSGGIFWTSNLNTIGTVRGRLGYLWAPNTLLYVTGGGAWGRVNYSSGDAFAGGCLTAPPNCGITSFSDTGSGYVVGAGIDWAPWSNNWVVRAEYLYYNLSGATGVSFFPGTGAVAANPVWNNISIQSARVGLSYKFW
jgi:outer membrane immunogenic protein